MGRIAICSHSPLFSLPPYYKSSMSAHYVGHTSVLEGYRSSCIVLFFQRQKSTLDKAQWNILPRLMTKVMNTGHEAETLALYILYILLESAVLL